MSTAARTPSSVTAGNHGRRVVIAWLVLSAIATPLVAIYVGPLFPPGNATVQSQGQVFDNQVMTALMTPVICLLAVFFVYGLVTFRAEKNEALLDGPPVGPEAKRELADAIARMRVDYAQYSEEGHDGATELSRTSFGDSLADGRPVGDGWPASWPSSSQEGGK